MEQEPWINLEEYGDGGNLPDGPLAVYVHKGVHIVSETIEIPRSNITFVGWELVASSCHFWHRKAES